MIPNPKWVKQISTWQAQYVTHDFISVRKHAESDACALLNTKPGNFDKETLDCFLRLLNTEFVPWKGQAYSKGAETLTRFQQSFSGANAKHIIECRVSFNNWIPRLWNAPQSQLAQLLNSFWEKKPIRRAGTGLPTTILYLKDSLDHNVWLDYTARGLTFITGIPIGSSRTYATYQKYDDAAKQFRLAYGLQPQEVDFILFLANRERLKAKQETN
jgi:hypothetical protein